MKVTVTLTESNIELGKKMDCKKCPIAIALINKGFKGVYVGGSGIKVEKGGKVYCAELTNKAADFINAFDEGRAVKPAAFTFSFEEEATEGEAMLFASI